MSQPNYSAALRSGAPQQPPVAQPQRPPMRGGGRRPPLPSQPNAMAPRPQQPYATQAQAQTRGTRPLAPAGQYYQPQMVVPVQQAVVMQRPPMMAQGGQPQRPMAAPLRQGGPAPQTGAGQPQPQVVMSATGQPVPVQQMGGAGQPMAAQQQMYAHQPNTGMPVYMAPQSMQAPQHPHAQGGAAQVAAVDPAVAVPQQPQRPPVPAGTMQRQVPPEASGVAPQQAAQPMVQAPAQPVHPQVAHQPAAMQQRMPMAQQPPSAVPAQQGLYASVMSTPAQPQGQQPVQHVMQAVAARPTQPPVRQAQAAAPSGGQYSYGFVKQVMSGDTVVIFGNESPGHPRPTKTVTLDGISAQRFSLSRNQSDEFFGWEAREFLRKRLVGTVVGFSITQEAKPTERNGRNYGDIQQQGEPESVSFMMVANGWAKVRMKNFGNPEKMDDTTRKAYERYEKLQQAQTRAREAKVGVWQADVNVDEHLRQVDWDLHPEDAQDLYRRYMGRDIPAVVESVREGSTLRCELLAEDGTLQHRMVWVHLAGVSCPKMPLPLPVLKQQWLRQQANARESGEPFNTPEPTEEKPSLAALLAKQWTEFRLLNRDVRVRLDSVDKLGNLYGSIMFHQGNISVSLLQNGHGKFVAWSANCTPNRKELHDAQTLAQRGRKGCWKHYNPEQQLNGSSKRFQAKVMQIVSGDTVRVLRTGAKKEDRFSLSSIRAPRQANRYQGAGEAYAREAREFLRSRLIGRNVTVEPEYERKSSAVMQQRGVPKQRFAAVFNGAENIAQSLVRQGLAQVIAHRRDEDRTAYYDQLLQASNAAELEGKGRWGAPPKKDPPMDLSERFRNDSSPEAAAKATQIKARSAGIYDEMTRKRNTRIQAIVEYVFNGNRVKLLLKDQNVMVAFLLSGIKAPGFVETIPERQEPFGEDAWKFARDRILQREVTIQIEAVDRGSNFIGHLFWGKKRNLGIDLLRMGFAKVVPRSAERSKLGGELMKAEKEAKLARTGLWKDWSPEQEAKRNEDVAIPSRPVKSGKFKVNVTHIEDSARFYAVDFGDQNQEAVNAALAGMKKTAAMDVKPRRGVVCAAPYRGQYYRCRIVARAKQGEGPPGSYVVLFIDYGNRDVIKPNDFEALDPSVSGIPPLATAYQLAGLQAPSRRPQTMDYYQDAGQTFANLVFGQTCSATVVFDDVDRNITHVTLSDADGNVDFNRKLVGEGHCRVMRDPPKELGDIIRQMRDLERKARRSHVHMWEHGDAGSDDEDDR